MRNKDRKPGTEEQPAVVNFIMEPGHWLEGIVVDTSDRSIEGVQVTVGSHRGSTLTPYKGVSDTRTDEKGLFWIENLPGGNITVFFRANGLSEFSQMFDVDQYVSVVMQPEGVIIGRVIDKKTGQPIHLPLPPSQPTSRTPRRVRGLTNLSV